MTKKNKLTVDLTNLCVQVPVKTAKELKTVLGVEKTKDALNKAIEYTIKTFKATPGGKANE